MNGVEEICPDLSIAARALDAGALTGEIARKYQLSPKLLERGVESGVPEAKAAFPGIGHRGGGLPALDDAWRIADLERKIGQLTMENDFLKKALQHFRDHHPPAAVKWRGCLLEEIGQAAEKGKAVSALCQMTGLSRAGYYRWPAAASHARSHGTAEPASASRRGMAGWISKNHRRAEAPGL